MCLSRADNQSKQIREKRRVREASLRSGCASFNESRIDERENLGQDDPLFLVAWQSPRLKISASNVMADVSPLFSVPARRYQQSWPTLSRTSHNATSITILYLAIVETVVDTPRCARETRRQITARNNADKREKRDATRRVNCARRQGLCDYVIKILKN